jgi:hypothetical protein
VIDRQHWFGVVCAASIFTLMAAFHGLLAENFAHLVAELLHHALLFSAVVGAAGFAILTSIFWKREHFEQFFKNRQSEAAQTKPEKWTSTTSLALLVFVAMAAAHGVLSINMAHWLKQSFSANDWVWIAIGFIVFFGGTLCLWALKTKLFTIKAVGVAQSEIGTPHAAMAVILSIPNSDKKETQFKKAEEVFRAKVGTTPDGALWKAGLAELCRAFEADHPLHRWNIQQPLRALYGALDKATLEVPFLDYVVLCSAESRMRWRQFSALLETMLELWPDDLGPRYSARVLNVDLVHGSVQSNYEILRKVLEKLQNDHAGRTVTIDVTGGTAEHSIAAALATVSRKVSFNYVDTNTLKGMDFDVQAFAAGISAE